MRKLILALSLILACAQQPAFAGLPHPKQLAQASATTGQVIAWDGSKYAPTSVSTIVGGPRFETDSTNALSNLTTLFAHWPLSEVSTPAGTAGDIVRDVMGRLPLTVNGTPGITMGSGPSTQELTYPQFTSGYFLKNASSVDWLSGSTSYTVAAWLKIDTGPSSGNSATIIARQRSSNGGGWGLRVKNSGGTLYLESFIGAGGAANQVFAGSTSMSTGTWYHVAGAYDGTNIYNWVNGVQSTTAATTNISAPSTDSLLTIGSDQAGQNLLGRVCLVTLWKGVSHPTAQILELYGSGTPNRLRL